MPHYLIRFGLTSESWRRLVESPEDRREAVRATVEAAGGKLHGYWYSFGYQDGFLLVEGPDNVAAAAVSVATASAGALRFADTTVLITVEEMLQALAKAKELPYRPPGG